MTKKFWLESKRSNREFPLLNNSTSLPINRLILLLFWTILLELMATLTSYFSDSNNSIIFFGVSSYQLLLPIFLLLIYHYFSKQKIGTLFGKIKVGDLCFGFILTLLSGIYSFLSALFIKSDSNQAMNFPVNGTSDFDRYLNLITSIISNISLLMTEELVVVITFIVVVNLFFDKCHVSRSLSIFLGWIISSLFFGMMHFYAYDWNFEQMFLVIGGARMFDTAIYIRTKNVWISYIFHLAWDSLILIVVSLT